VRFSLGLVPIALETFRRTGKMAQDFLRESCKHLLRKNEELSDVRAQMNRVMPRERGDRAWRSSRGPGGESTGPCFFFRT